MEAMCETSEAMWPEVRGRPIMTLLRHARLANMAVTRLGLSTVLHRAAFFSPLARHGPVPAAGLALD